jgi:hypothetical protein
MSRKRKHDWSQLVLTLEPPKVLSPIVRDSKALLEALAELLLEALGVESRCESKHLTGGAHERQDHA